MNITLSIKDKLESFSQLFNKAYINLIVMMKKI